MARVCNIIFRYKVNFTGKLNFSLTGERQITLRSFKSSSTPINLKYRRGNVPRNFLKSSRSLKDSPDLEIVLEKSSKPRKYLVLGDVTVDEDTFKKIQAEDMKEYDDFDDEDLQNALQNSEEFFSLYKMEEKEQRFIASYKSLKRKLLPAPLEPSLLTWAAREQVLYLHQQDSEEWTPEEISNHFPISVSGAKKLIRSKFRHVSEERIVKYNQKVRETWRNISKGDISCLEESLQERWLNRKLRPSQALPNPALPLPPPTNTNPSLFLLDDPNRSVGEFYSLVKPYIGYKQKSQQLASSNSSSSSVFAQQRASGNEMDQWIPDDSDPTIDNDVNEVDERKHRSQIRRLTHLTHRQFEKNFVEKLQNKRFKTNADNLMLEWMEKQTLLLNNAKNDNNISYSPEAQSKKLIPKHKKYPKCVYEPPREIIKSDEEVCQNNANNGYQHPFGKSDTSNERSKIDRKGFKKEGELYKLGDSFYSSDGEFLFKLLT